MKRIFFLIYLVISILSFTEAQSTPLSSTLFMQKNKENEGTETYQCIQIRRGDKITLTGNISLVQEDTESIRKTLSFTSLGGRTFLLEGEHLQDLTDLYISSDKNILITLKGIVLFEGLEEIPAELKVTDFKSSD